ncbi:GGDEF domain-containing protein [Candidatus Xianfuyuplasma coldseepsis]|uniref:GGDEF domain-containing protein n=1 Tax=Candidatus Xianfuyuplasma coldseepsis TaxID=2782163 RepID=A0A7L7KT16_9MOLU|nr:GGDEF domain-containing protein [Xianfuyuplasma coldseepsis]QMS85376.1 GGDEF domain-containing protein [Xianfuyuplasma coldseepsis]
MENFYRYDNNIYAFALLVILLFVVITKKDIFDYSRKLFYRMIVFNMVILVVEILAWAFDGINTSGAIVANYIFNVLLILMEPTMAAQWVTYVDYKIHGSRDRLRKRLYYLQPTIFAGILLVINIVYPVAFSLDEQNVYHRGEWLWLSLLFVFGMILYTVILAVKNRKELSDKMILFIAFFALLPVLISFIQLFVYGLILTWAVVALGVVFAYYLIEIAGNSEDHLTGLFSRKKMEEILTGKVEENETFSVIMIDLEYFKKINDQYGHKQGDEVLQQLSKVLLRAYKEEFYVTRIGGDEFLLISKQATRLNIEEYRDRLLREIKQSKNPLLLEIGISFGAKTFDSSMAYTEDSILDEVDRLMYEDKSKNKNYKRRRTD